MPDAEIRGDLAERSDFVGEGPEPILPTPIMSPWLPCGRMEGEQERERGVEKERASGWWKGCPLSLRPPSRSPSHPAGIR
jgi:hypothetical protein